jgi:hypothetical protein
VALVQIIGHGRHFRSLEIGYEFELNSLVSSVYRCEFVALAEDFDGAVTCIGEIA